MVMALGFHGNCRLLHLRRHTSIKKNTINDSERKHRGVEITGRLKKGMKRQFRR